MGCVLKLLTRHAQEGDGLLDSIVTGDQTWVFHHTTESKQQSLQRRHKQSPRNKKLKTSISVKKIMAPVFEVRKGILLVDFMPPAQVLMPLYIVTHWYGFDEPFKTKGGEC